MSPAGSRKIQNVAIIGVCPSPDRNSSISIYYTLLSQAAPSALHHQTPPSLQLPTHPPHPRPRQTHLSLLHHHPPRRLHLHHNPRAPPRAPPRLPRRRRRPNKPHRNIPPTPHYRRHDPRASPPPDPLLLRHRDHQRPHPRPATYRGKCRDGRLRSAEGAEGALTFTGIQTGSISRARMADS